MQKRIWSMFTFFLVAAMLLTACAGGGAEETLAPTEAMTEEATEAMTEEATEVMTEEPTEAMTEEPTEAMTEEPTEEMTEEATEAATQAPVSGEIDCGDAQPGDEISMIYQWSGQEEERLNTILAPFVEACQIVLAPESTREGGILDTRVQSGNPPDITFLDVTTLAQYEAELVAMDELGASADSYSDFWVQFGTVNGRWLGLPVKADIKTIIWYSPVAFEAFGYEVPETWEELDALVEQMVADGNVPWSMGFESGADTGWAGSDFIQDILLVTQGPEFIQGLIDGSISYDDPGVREAYEIYGKWAMDDQYTVGGAEGTLSTAFVPAIYRVFSDPPEAMMVKQSGFAGGEIVKQFPDLEYGTDFDFFQVPGAQGLQGGSDWMMAFTDTPAVRALVAYLSSPLGGQNWAASGFDLSPNQAGQGFYPDEQVEKRAEILATATGFTPDIGDTISQEFARAEWQAIIDYVNGGDLDAALAEVAEVQQAAVTQ